MGMGRVPGSRVSGASDWQRQEGAAAREPRSFDSSLLGPCAVGREPVCSYLPVPDPPSSAVDLASCPGPYGDGDGHRRSSQGRVGRPAVTAELAFILSSVGAVRGL